MPKKTRGKKLTRDEKRNLDVEIGFLEGLVRKDPQYVEALQILGDDYTKRGRFDDGLDSRNCVRRMRQSSTTWRAAIR
jgi:hypothetical protein